MSLFRPGTLRMCIALARTTVKGSSSTCQTGFQYTPVASIAACVQPLASSHSAISSPPSSFTTVQPVSVMTRAAARKASAGEA